MNRILASSLGMTLGLLAAAGRADDLVWRAARDRTVSLAVTAALRGSSLRRISFSRTSSYVSSNLARSGGGTRLRVRNSSARDPTS